ncbi:MAG: glycosyltransferase family 2 protein [Traorella sp.]
MDSLLFSIIVPIYNSEKYLEKCILSILRQTYERFELILVNDGSTDKSEDICLKYQQKDLRIKYLSQKNAGHTDARNTGFDHSSGEYILFVDSDDWIDLNTLEKCYEHIENKRIDMILFGYRRIFDKNIKEKPQKYNEGYYEREKIEEMILKNLLFDERFSLSERIIHRDLVANGQNKVDKRLIMGEDLVSCVWMMCNVQRIYVDSNCYYNYFQHEDSIAHTYRNYTFEDWQIIKKILDDNIKNYLANYDDQIGYLSVRFLSRAVLGEINRNGLSVNNVLKIKKQLRIEKETLRKAVSQNRKLSHEFKKFCLLHEFVYILYFCDLVNSAIKKKG